MKYASSSWPPNSGVPHAGMAHTTQQIADELGISRQRVDQIIVVALGKCRRRAKELGVEWSDLVPYLAKPGFVEYTVNAPEDLRDD